MTDRFDEAKRALEDVPAPDMWAEAERRAHGDPVVPLATVAPDGGRHRGRWLAAAAAAAVLVAGTVAVLANDGDDPVTTEPTVSSATTDPHGAVTTYQADGACTLGVTGEPLPEPATVSADGAVGTLVEGSLNGTQDYAISVPGQFVRDLVGERVEDVQLRHGTAKLWFQSEAVQVRWFPGSQEPCESFTVNVGGGTEDENRHAAVDLADRVVLLGPSAPPSTTTSTSTVEPTTSTTVTEATQPWPIDGDWDLYSVQPPGSSDPTYPPDLQVSFDGEHVTWDDYCRTETGTVERIDGETFSIANAPTQPGFGCAPNDDASAIAKVMYADRIHASLEGAAGSVYLTLAADTGDELVLRRPNTGSSPSGRAPLG